MNKRKLKEIQNFLTAVRLAEGDMSLQRLATLIEVALHGQIDQSALVKSAQLSRGAASKNIASWSRLTALKDRGPGYLKSDLDPMNLKLRIISLTPAGETMLTGILTKAGLEDH